MLDRIGLGEAGSYRQGMRLVDVGVLMPPRGTIEVGAYTTRIRLGTWHLGPENRATSGWDVLLTAELLPARDVIV
jgi:hypothetical protein